MKIHLRKLILGTVLAALIGSGNVRAQEETWGMVLNEDIFGLSKVDDFGFQGSFGFGYTPEGRLWKTTDGGVNWAYETISGFSPAFPDASQLIKQVYFFDSQNAVFRYANPGQNDVYYSSNDGGTTLSFVSDLIFSDYTFTSISKTHYVDNMVWYKWKRALRNEDSQLMDAIMLSTDGGVTWVDISENLYTLFGSSNWIISDLQFISATVAFAYTEIGLCKTTDGGATWSLANSNLSGYGKVHFVDANTGYVAHHDPNFNTLLKTTDGGASLNPTSLNDQTEYTCSDIGAGTTYGETITNLYSMDFYDALNGVAVCSANGFPVVVRTLDGGDTWIQDSIDLEILSGSTVWSGFTPVQMVTPDAAFTQIVVNTSKRYVIGFGEATGGPSAITEMAQEDVVVFPNPATATTIDIKHDSAKSIALMNAAGQILKSINCNHRNFNSIDISDLASGIYFVKVETENSSITKKVIVQ